MENKRKANKDSSFVRRALSESKPDYWVEVMDAVEEDEWMFSNFDLGFEEMRGEITVDNGIHPFYELSLDAEGNLIADLDLNLYNNEFEEGEDGWIPLIDVKVWVEINMSLQPYVQPHRIGWEITGGDLSLFKRTKGYLPETPRLTRRPK